MRKLLYLFFLIGILSISCKEPNPVLTIEGGKVIGVKTQTDGIIAYKGIPFAAPPLGELRWKEPQPVVPWKGIRLADTYGAAAWQVDRNPDSFCGREWQASGTVPFSEDCLYLNIWTPAAGKKEKKLPVALWIHGGGFQRGFAYEPEMDGGEYWASKDVILVQVTYRLGLLGFFSHPLLSGENTRGISGNYGLFDQYAALRWIRNNIEQFGGDPDNITIFGQSAGAYSVQALCASPLSRNLISNAIIMSGGGLSEGGPKTLLDTAQMANMKFMDHFEISSLDEMRALTFEELMNMSEDYTSATSSKVHTSPVIDGYFSTDIFMNVALTNEIADIPYMLGFTANDLSDKTKAIGDFCILRDKVSTNPAYAYFFKRALPGDESGAFHCADLWYVFHSFVHSWRPFTSGDKDLSRRMVTYWTNFVKYGNPNNGPERKWTPYTDGNPEFMSFNVVDNEAVCFMTRSVEYKGRR